MRLSLGRSVCLAVLLGSVGLSMAPASAYAQAAAERIEVSRGNSWYPATVLKREGNRVQIHYQGLSEDFDEWVGPERIREATVSPPRPVSPPAGRLKENESTDQAPPDGPRPKITAAKRSGANEIIPDLQSAPGRWSLKADAPAGTPPQPPAQATKLFRDPEQRGRPGRSFREQIDDPLFSDLVVPRAILPRISHTPGKRGLALRLETVDLAAGKSVGLAEMPPDVKPIDLSPDGGHVLLRDELRGSESNQLLEVFSVNGEKTERVASWKPYEDGDAFARHVDWARFVDNTHVLTLNSGGEVVLWELPRVKAVYVLKLDGHATAALSPGRKYVAISIDRTLCVFEAATGTLLAASPGESLAMPKLSFRPDGKQIAAAFLGHVRVWDFETGKTVHDITLPPGSHGTQLDWVADNYVLLDNRYLLDLPHRIILWEYTIVHGLPKGVPHAGRFWYLVNGPTPGSKVLASAVLPDAAAKKAAAGLDFDKLLAVKLGASVSLEINIDFPSDVRERVRKAVETKLKANGLTISDGQPVKLTLTTAPGESKKVKYRRAGRPGATTVSVDEQKLRAAFEMGGKPIWENTSTSGAPIMIHLKKDQTVEQAIADLKTNGWRFFEKLDIPKQVPRLPEKTAYGTSKLTADGPQAIGNEPER